PSLRASFSVILYAAHPALPSFPTRRSSDLRAGQTLELTVKEFEVLEYLLRHVGHVVPREMLTRDVWRIAARATPLDNVIDVTIADRKSTRLNSSHGSISYAVFCLKKKNKNN